MNNWPVNEIRFVLDLTLQRRLSDQWLATVDAVASAAGSVDRDPAEVRIVGVSKYVDEDMTRALMLAGCLDLGESRPQRLVEKAERLIEPGVRWHLIGQLQRNKVRRVVETAACIHSVDSLRLLQAVAQAAMTSGRSPQILIEVNVSGDPTKAGFSIDELPRVWPDVLAIGYARVEGLMAMSGIGSSRDQVRRQFASLRDLRDRLVNQFSMPLPELSMGMSDDFVEAIAEGATIVRIGSRLFEPLIT